MKRTTKFMLITGVLTSIGMLFVSLNLQPKIPVKPKDLVAKIEIPDLNVAAIAAKATLKPIEIHHAAYNYLVQEKGLSRNHALGLIANGDRESHWIIDVTCGERSAGIFQWFGKRCEKFRKAVPDWTTNWKAQLDYALSEDVGPEWVQQDFKTPEAAAKWWCRYWERPKNLARATVKNNRFIENYSF